MNKIFTLFLITICFGKVSFAQYIASISPSTISAGQTLNVTITGSGTHFTSGSPSTYAEFGFNSCSATVNAITVNSPTSLTANITTTLGNIYTGYYDFQVYDQVDGLLLSDRSIYLTGGVTPPVAISPDSGAPGQLLTVTITGNGTQFLQGSSSTINFDFDLNQDVCVTSWAGFTATPSSNTIATGIIAIPIGTPSGYYDVHIGGGTDNYIIDNMFHVISGVSVNEVEKEYDVTIGPSPFSTYTSLEYTLQRSEDVKTEVYDLFGKKILEKHLGKQSVGKHNLRIDAADLNFTSGIYILHFTADNRSFSKRIVLNKE